MINLLLPCKKAKIFKPAIRGLWLDNKKLYYDYIKIIPINSPIHDKLLQDYAIRYNQLCIFYKGNNLYNYAYLYDNRNKNTTVLTNKIVYRHVGNKGLKNLLKSIINKYGGLTIYKKSYYYIIEVYTS